MGLSYNDPCCIYASSKNKQLLRVKNTLMSACLVDVLACVKRNAIFTLRIASLALSVSQEMQP